MVHLIRDTELAKLLGGVSTMTLWRMRQRGQLPRPRKLNGQNYTPENELEQVLENLFESEVQQECTSLNTTR